MSQTKVQLIQPVGIMTAPGVNVSGTLTATTFDGNLVGAAGSIIGAPNVNAGIVTAVSFYGNGENITGVAGSTFIGVVTAAQSGTTTIDLSLGNIIYFTQDTNTTVAFANTESVQVVDFIRTKDDTTDARTIAWPDSIIWNGGSAPTLISAGGTNAQIFKLITRDQGITWYGYETQQTEIIPPPAVGGTLFGWGRNNRGELGLNDESNRSSPTQIPGTDWTMIAGGNGKTLWLNSSGELYGTGDSRYLGQNQSTEIEYSSPRQIPGTQWSDISSGNYNAMALKTDGTLWGWSGYNSDGQLGQNNRVAYSSPVQLPGSQWSKVSTVRYGVVATKTDGTLWTWGWNRGGYNTLGHRSSPTQIPGSQWTGDVFATYDAWWAIKSDGTLWGCGENGNGDLGQNDKADRSSPVQLPGTTWNRVSQMWSGQTVLGTKTDGTLWAWGYDSAGRSGLNQQVTDNPSPVQIPGNEWSNVSAEYDISIATKTDGTLWVWGYGNYGLGGQNGGSAFPVNGYRSSPTQIPGTNWHRNQIKDVFQDGFAFKTS